MDFDLDPTEKELFDEINIVSDEPTNKPSKPFPSRNFRRPAPEVTFADDDEPIDAFANVSKMNVPQPPPPTEWDGGEGPPPQPQSQPRMFSTGPSDGYKSIEDEKADLLNRIARLAKRGMQTSSRFTIYSDIEDIRAEYKRLTYSIEVEQSIKFQRRMLIACVSGIEFLNKRFDPFDLDLDGWSENMMESQEDYDTVFEELFQKYRAKVNVAPEIKLMFMVGGSAMMFHLSKTMLKPFKEAAAAAQQQQQPSFSAGQKTPGERREMRGPGIDLASLGRGLDISSILGTLQQQQQQPMDTGSQGDISDIISIGSEVRELEISGGGGGGGEPRKKRGRSRSTSQKKELVL